MFSELLPLFDSEEVPALGARLAPRLRELGERGVCFGTSSWRYIGWIGQIYTRERYLVRGKFSTKKFEAECLREYAETFPVVCGDFSFYNFPTADYWARLFGATPSRLQFALKVPEEITVHTWPSHPRYGARGGRRNESFLDGRLFERAFLQPLRAHRERVVALIFEFGTFSRKSFPQAADFLDRLQPFLAALPDGFRYAVEIRNPEYLLPDYFALLARQNVAHTFNAWTRMPALDQQAARPEAYTADFTVVRALLRKDRPYEMAVRMFEPYRSIQEPVPSAREGMRMIVDRALSWGRPAFLFVNNRLEGNAPGTIEAVVSTGP